MVIEEKFYEYTVEVEYKGEYYLREEFYNYVSKNKRITWGKFPLSVQENIIVFYNSGLGGWSSNYVSYSDTTPELEMVYNAELRNKKINDILE